MRKDKQVIFLGRTLPRSWEELKFSQYVAIMNEIKPEHPRYKDEQFGPTHKLIDILASMLNISTSDVEASKLTDLREAVQCIEFMGKPPKRGRKCQILKLPAPDAITFDQLVTFSGYAGRDISDLPAMVSAMTLDSLGENEINNLSVAEVYAAFFTLTKNVLKFLNRYRREQARKVLQKMWQNLWQQIRLRLTRRRKNPQFKRFSGGTS